MIIPYRLREEENRRDS